MHTELLREKILEQVEVYQALKSGDVSNVQYRKFVDTDYGIQDANYTNRMRLAYYLLYENKDDEEVVEYLFCEEIKDRNSNSFQGIGNTLNVLASILIQYNIGSKYDGILDEAKNANFDCACGFDKNCQISNNMKELDLMDCIYLSRDLDYKDVMETLVAMWKNGIEEWNDRNREMLTKFNSYLGKEQENEMIYIELLKNAIQTRKSNTIVSAYNKVIRYYINSGQFGNAYSYLKCMIDTTNFEDIKRIRLFGDVLEECFEIICGYQTVSKELWKWAKPYLKKSKNMYGNLYTKGIAAAKCVKDVYLIQLEKEYRKWRKEVNLK